MTAQTTSGLAGAGKTSSREVKNWFGTGFAAGPFRDMGIISVTPASSENTGNVSKITRIRGDARSPDATIHGKTVYVSGPVGKTVKEQTLEAMEEAEQIFGQVGSDKSKILCSLICLSDRKDFDDVNGVWVKWFEGAMGPCRATGQTATMAPDYHIKIIMTAAI